MKASNRTRILLCMAASLLWTGNSTRAQLVWRVSVKFIHGPNDERPGGSVCSDVDCAADSPDDCAVLAQSAISCELEVQRKLDYANEILARYGRGYRFELDEAIDLMGLPAPPDGIRNCVGGDNDGEDCSTDNDCSPGGSCLPPGTCQGGTSPGAACDIDADCGTGGTCVPHWFNAPSDNDTRRLLEQEAEANPSLYAWSENAINIYILNTDAGGYASRPPGSLIVIGQRRRGNWVRPIHEIGHFFSLCHTHGGGSETCLCGDAPCPTAESNCDVTLSGEECNVGDTLPDNCCWEDPNLIASMSYYGGCCFGVCDPSDVCTIATNAECQAMGGIYLGNGSGCDSFSSLSTGACWDNTGGRRATCTIETRTTCQSDGRFYRGDESTCTPYDTDLTSTQRAQVDDVWSNVMAYHRDHGDSSAEGPDAFRDRFTDDQLDTITDLSNGHRFSITDGCTHFVDANANLADLTGLGACGYAPVCTGGTRNGEVCVGDENCPGSGECGYRDGSSRVPYTNLESALNAAGTGDLVMLRGGVYEETFTGATVIDQPLMLLSSRGSALIGTSAP